MYISYYEIVFFCAGKECIIFTTATNLHSYIVLHIAARLDTEHLASIERLLWVGCGLSRRPLLFVLAT